MVSIFEYDEEKELELYRKAERAVGKEEGYRDGLEQGLERGIEAFILDNQEAGNVKDSILMKLQKRFKLTEEQAVKYYYRYAQAEQKS